MNRKMISLAALTTVLSATVTMATVTMAADPGPADPGPLVTANSLNMALQAEQGAPTVLDIRGDAYANGHIEGAVSAPYGLFRGPGDNPGQMVPVQTLEATYEKLGLEPGQPVVIVAQGKTDSDFGAAARVYWTLKSSGFDRLSILNGGEQAWVNAGLPISKQAVTPTPTRLSITWDNTWTAKTPDVQKVVDGKQKALLIDARPAAFFEGRKVHPAAARPGTLPGARDYPYTRFFQPGATAISKVTDVKALRASLGLADGQQAISFCNTGHWAATNWFALNELAGLGDVKLYPGSVVEYSKTGGKMENTPGLIDNLLNQFRGSS